MLANVAKSDAAPAMKNAITQTRAALAPLGTSIEKRDCVLHDRPGDSTIFARHPALSVKD